MKKKQPKKYTTSKYTKKQCEKIDSLVCMMDELDNKPRRLFTALREFTEAFFDGEDYRVTENRRQILDSIDQWERDYYKTKSKGWYAMDIFNAQQDISREMHSENRKWREGNPDRGTLPYEVDDALGRMAALIAKGLSGIDL